MTPIVVFVSLIFLSGLVSRRLERTIVTAPTVFATAGIILHLMEKENQDEWTSMIDSQRHAD